MKIIPRILILALFLAVVLATVGVAPAADRPNILFVFGDEHRWQSLPFTEDPELRTPAMERLARDGASFGTCISNNPICVPARTMIMTGRWPYATRALENNGAVIAPEHQPALGKVFHAAGYRTGYIGKWHIGMRPESAGFDQVLVWGNTNNHWKSYFSGPSGKKITYDGYNATGMTDQALEFIESSAKADEPFFLMLAWNPPHAKLEDAPAAARALYAESPPESRPSLQIKEKDQQQALDAFRGYRAHITAIDGELDRLLRKLEELDLARNTIVIYTSDHGSMFGAHGKASKRHPEEESLRVPFLVLWPGHIPAGSRPEQLLGTIDIFPTLCGLAGISVPASSQGMNLAPAVLGEEMRGPESQFIMHISNSKEFDKVANDPKARVFRPFFRGVRTPRYTYTVGVHGPWLLFDNQKDPYQLKNLIDDPAYESAREECKKQLDVWLEKAEYANMPEEMRKKVLSMNLPDRIAWQNIEAVEFARSQKADGFSPEGE